MYLEDDGRYVVTGSGAGSAADPQWFKNLRSTHEAEIEIGRRKLAVGVAVAAGEQRDILWNEAGRARTLLRRLPEEGRAADTNGDLDAQNLTHYRSCRGRPGVLALFRTRSHMRPDSGCIAFIRGLVENLPSI